eukprot:CAMPEP_0117677992 /NCGR_PEP_ID=MMETSP0804-20121206/17040_1 /TAXON_ID=1074897 /ORGANISM="Tetraselmis astigmatica, Strain CCMP880" /LENGTH=744 /DNA_ID=CAMNT_0005487311 /DNA_START=46 /DNA_END=2280 /DNA_ORIENTATION=-
MTRPAPTPGGGEGLVVAGVRLMLDGVIDDLRSGDERRQSRALQALSGMSMTSKKQLSRPAAAVAASSSSPAPPSSVASSSSSAALQDGFREAGGFEALVAMLSTDGSPLREGSALVAGAVDALLLLTKGSKASVGAAVAAGATEALVALVGEGDEAPVSLSVLKALHVLMNAEDRAPVHQTLMDAGGVEALIRVLDAAMLRAKEPDASLWAREVATLLFELVRCNPSTSSFLCSSGVVASTLKILSVCEDPLCLSLGLDILEEIVNSEDRMAIRTVMMSEGAVPALVRVMHVKGIGSKAALALAFMGEDPRHMPVLLSVLEIEDMACLCHIAALAADADDLDAGCCIEFIQLLLESPGSLHVLRCLVMARCVGVCLALAPLQACLLRQLSDPSALADICMLLDSASTYGRLESSLATLELLMAGSQGVRLAPFFPATASIMCRNGKVEAVVEVVLDEAAAAAAAPSDSQRDALDNEVTVLLAELIPSLPLPSKQEAASLAAPGSGPRPSSLFSTGGLCRSPATIHPAGFSSSSARGAGFSSHDVNTKRYDSITFLVGGREFYALGWVLEQSSGRLRRLLKQQVAGGDLKTPVAVPPIDGLTPDAAYQLFALAVEFAYTGYAAIDPADELSLWAMAASLEMEELQAHCEDTVAARFVSPGVLEAALQAAFKYRSGNRLRDLCVTRILEDLMEMHSSGRLGAMIGGGDGDSDSCRHKLQEGLVNVLSDRFLLAARRRHGPSAATRR